MTLDFTGEIRRIREIERPIARNGKPYVFIHFTDLLMLKIVTLKS